MPESAQVVSDPAQTMTPIATMGFGARESADETRQAQQSVSNDAPTDVNMNATVARAQAYTYTRSSDNFETNSDRRNKIADEKFAKMQ
jgi:hypothetical protein